MERAGAGDGAGAAHGRCALVGAGRGRGWGLASCRSTRSRSLRWAYWEGLWCCPRRGHHLRSRWLWAGLLLALLLASPNLVWLLRHRFITLQMESFIHARDVRNGRTDGYYTDQLRFTMLGLPLAVAGAGGAGCAVSAFVCSLSSTWGRLPFLRWCGAAGTTCCRRTRCCMQRGRFGSSRCCGVRSRVMRVTARGLVAGAVLINCALIAWSYLPVWRAGSPAWVWQMKNNSDMADEMGWPEFVAQVAAVRDGLPAGERTQVAVAANNYGEAGALALYGPAYGLPTPISTVNSFHDRGYGPFAPETVIVTGGRAGAGAAIVPKLPCGGASVDAGWSA